MNIILLEEEWNWNNVSLEKFVKDAHYPSSWEDFFNNKEVITIIEVISDRLREEKIEIYPSINHVFRAFIPLEKIKVVVLGQDPYHDGSAVGICFQVPKNRKINPSLRNIYKELCDEGFKGDITTWKTQGCFMLNTALTVLKGLPESHLEIWEPFTNVVCEYISKNTDNVGWLLMGAKSHRYERYVNIDKGHKAFKTSHPSPLGAYKGNKNAPAFMGSGVFKNINSFLGKNSIMW